MDSPEIFISYSHKDYDLAARLLTHLRVLENEGFFKLWIDHVIETGEDWYKKLKEAMGAAKVAILLVSANSLTSDFILREEVAGLLKRRDTEGLRIFPVIAKPCSWQDVGWLAKMQVHSKDPLSTLSEHEVDERLAAIARDVRVIVTGASQPNRPSTDLVRDYCVKVTRRFSILRTLSTWDKQKEGISDHHKIDRAFVPLQLSERWAAGSGEQTPSKRIKDLFFNGGPDRRFLLRGLPGSGKTTLLYYLAHQFAQIRLSGQSGLVPVYARLKGFDFNRNSLLGLVRQAINDTCTYRSDADFLFDEGRLLDGNTVILFDGLDEIAGSENTENVAQAMHDFAIEHPFCMIIVTSRPIGLEPSDYPRYRLLDLEPLNSELIDVYLNKWFAGKQAIIAEVKSVLSANPRIASLATNPFLLSMICSTIEAVGSAKLVRNRSDLYSVCTEYLIKRLYDKEHQRVSEESYRNTVAMLKDVAWRFFSWQESDFPLDHITVMGGRKLPAGFTSNIEELLDRIQQVCGLIHRSGDSYTFVHKSLWEYFTALSLLEKKPDYVIRYAANPDWEEVIRLYFGLKMAEGGDVSALVRELWIANKPLTVRVCSEIEKTKVLIYEVLSKDKRRAKTEKLLLLDSLEDSLHLITRHEWESLVEETLRILLINCEEKDCEVIFRAEELLQRLGMRPLNAGSIIYEIFDLANTMKRQEQFLLDPQNHFLWIDVEGGEFLMGEDHYMFNEGPSRMVTVKSFSISKHPVTNRMASGFPFLELKLTNASPSAPVVGLTWYECRYFALWIGCRLPRESEWEYAARGGTNTIRTHRDIDAPYFFGSSVEELARHVWYDDPAREHPHAVDELNPRTQKENLNPLGIANILGNVWEWCDDIYSNYEASGDEVETAQFHQKEMMSGEKVLRGGTFRGSKDTVRCGRRVFSHPGNRGSTVGFRLVCDKGASDL